MGNEREDVERRIATVGERWAERVGESAARRGAVRQRLNLTAVQRRGIWQVREALAEGVRKRLESDDELLVHGLDTPESIVPGSKSAPESSGELKPTENLQRDNEERSPISDRNRTSEGEDVGSIPSTNFPERVARIIERMPQHRLDGRVERLLSQALDIRIPTVRLFVNQAADGVARAHGADAVAYGKNVLFRTDRFEPQTPEGLGLLGHEVTHAAQVQEANGRDGPLSPGVMHRQEEAALQNEQRVREAVVRREPSFAYPPLPMAKQNEAPVVNTVSSAPSPITNSPALVAFAPVVPTPVQAQAAASDRNLGGAGSAPVSLSEREMRRIKDAVYEDLLARIRVEFERGA